jgi:hypothetical protein
MLKLQNVQSSEYNMFIYFFNLACSSPKQAAEGRSGQPWLAVHGHFYATTKDTVTEVQSSSLDVEYT